MTKLAFVAITVAGLAVVVSVIGYVTGEETYAPLPTSWPVSVPTSPPAPPLTVALVPTPLPPPTPSPTPVPTPSQTPTPTVTPAPTPTPTPVEGVPQGASVYYGEQPPYVRSECSPCKPEDDIRLANNPAAADPTWGQLESFLLADDTDKNLYVPGIYVCGAFAEDLHNNAEAAGIRTAWVALDFFDDPEGHALNAFNTVDRGLVFVDSTGRRLDEGPNSGDTDSWDKVAYVGIGEEYGQVSFDAAACPGYTCYEDYVQRKLDFEIALEDYNQRVDVHNVAVAEYIEWADGKTFITGTEDAERMEEWYDELKEVEYQLDTLQVALQEERDSLGTFWEPMGTVSSVELYW